MPFFLAGHDYKGGGCLSSVINVMFALALLAQVLVLPFVIPLFGIGLEHLWRGLRARSESEARRCFVVVSITWGLIIMALIASGIPVWESVL
jgi:hypothetical protein